MVLDTRNNLLDTVRSAAHELTGPEADYDALLEAA